MLMIPMQSLDHRKDALIVVLDEAGVERMRQSDPAEVILAQCGKQLLNPTIMICFEKDHKSLDPFIQRGDIKGLITHLQRGWKFRPEIGDHDRGPESIAGQN